MKVSIKRIRLKKSECILINLDDSNASVKYRFHVMNSTQCQKKLTDKNIQKIFNNIISGVVIKK